MEKAGDTMVINGVNTRFRHNRCKIQIGREKHAQKFFREIGFSIARRQLGSMKHEKVLVEGIYIEPYKLIERGLFKLSFSDSQY